VAAILAFLYFCSNISFSACHCTFPFLSLKSLCTFQFDFHKHTFCVPFRYFYGVILLFLVIPRLTACALLCFIVGPPFFPVFIFLFHTTDTPFLIRRCFLYRKVFIYFLSSWYFVVLSSSVALTSAKWQ
jgi:hypothetical protein